MLAVAEIELLFYWNCLFYTVGHGEGNENKWS